MFPSISRVLFEITQVAYNGDHLVITRGMGIGAPVHTPNSDWGNDPAPNICLKCITIEYAKHLADYASSDHVSDKNTTNPF